jgi:hypothetical protein
VYAVKLASVLVKLASVLCEVGQYTVLWASATYTVNASPISVVSTTPYSLYDSPNPELCNIPQVTAFVTGDLRGYGHEKYAIGEQGPREGVGSVD